MIPKQFLTPRYWPTWFGLAILRCCTHLPRRIQLYLGHLLGILSYWLSPSRKHIASTNLSLCFPELEVSARQNLLKASYSSLGHAMIEMGMSWWLPLERMDSQLTIKNEHYLKQALSQQQGILLIGAHFTALDIVGCLFSRRYPTCVTYRRPKNKLIDYILRRNREQYFSKTIERQEMRTFIRALKNKQIVWYAPDQDYGRKVSIFAPFFNIPTATITTTIRIASLSDAIIIPIMCFRDTKTGQFTVELGPSFDNMPSGDDLADVTRINKYIEDAIRRHPDQYLWQHRRFKTRPIGEPRPY